MQLNHVTLIVSNLQESLRFYQTLGLNLIVLSAPRYARLTLPDSDDTLSLEVTGEARNESRVQIYLECPELDKVYEDLKIKGLVFEQEPKDMDYLWREARIRDPDGHQIRLYLAGDNRLNPPWRLK